MDKSENSPGALRVADLPSRRATRFSIVPDAKERADIARVLGIPAVKKLRFEGEVSPMAKNDWKLTAQLGATVTQTCVVSLEPLTTRIDTPIKRVFVAKLDLPTGEEVEMPEDDTIDSLGEFISPWDVMVEALSLELPPYPRTESAALDATQFTEPGKAAMTDQDTRPFAALSDLMMQSGKSEKPE